MGALAVADLGMGPAEGMDAELTLDAMVLGAWEALSSHRSAACPVCDGELMPVYERGARALGGSCRDCGARLS